MTAPIRVLVVDDHPLFLRGMQAALAEVGGDVEIVGAVESGAAAVETAMLAQPDVVLLDLNLPDVDGVEVTRRLMSRGFPGAVLILTMYDDSAALTAALAAGARGYLLKGSSAADVLAGIRAVRSGGVVFGAAVADTVISGLTRPSAPPSIPGLSGREVEILALIAQGHDNAVIARRLVLSEKTVRNHVSSIYSKLGVTDRASAIERARAAGLNSHDDPRLPWECT